MCPDPRGHRNWSVFQPAPHPDLPSWTVHQGPTWYRRSSDTSTVRVCQRIARRRSSLGCLWAQPDRDTVGGVRQQNVFHVCWAAMSWSSWCWCCRRLHERKALETDRPGWEHESLFLGSWEWVVTIVAKAGWEWRAWCTKCYLENFKNMFCKPSP